jgi:hypothetical protein
MRRLLIGIVFMFGCQSLEISPLQQALGGIAPPTLIAPLSSAYTTQQQPTFKVKLASGTDGAQMQLCADRACSLPIFTATLTAAGSYATGRPPAPLQPGVYFWSAVGSVAGTVGTQASPSWQVVIPHANGGTVDSSYGSYPDFNADGQADLVMVDSEYGVSPILFIYNGAAGAWPSTPSYTIPHAGAAPLAAAGDVNGDGYPDLATSMYYYNGYQQALIIPGGPGGPSTTTAYPVGQAGANYATQTAGIGDMDGDGFGDIAALSSNGYPMLTIYRGGASGLTQSAQLLVNLPNPTGCSIYTARSVSGGDVNGDGYGDIVVSGYAVSMCTPVRFIGANAWVYLGGPGGITTSTPAIALTQPGYPSPGYTGWGRTVVAGGDLNGDGYCDVVVGARDTSIFYSAGAFVYFGAASLPSTLPIAQSLTLQASTVFDIGLGLGDFNGDGVSDLVVGNSAVGTGSAFFGHAGAGLSSTADWMVTLGSTGGPAIANAGDVNRDGIADIVVGSYNSSKQNSSRAYLFLGQLLSPPSTTASQWIYSTDSYLGAGLAWLEKSAGRWAATRSL